MKKSDIGLIGLAVMGENLVMNMESKGFQVSVFNRTAQKVTDFLEGRAKGKKILGAYSLEELAGQLEKPRKENPKKAAERDELTERVLAVLASQDKPCSIKELREMEDGLGELTSQKISPIMKRLVEAGRVEKTTEKRVSMFRYIG